MKLKRSQILAATVLVCVAVGMIVAQPKLYRLANYAAGVRVFTEPRLISVSSEDAKTIQTTVEAKNNGSVSAMIFGVNTPCGVSLEQPLPIEISAGETKTLKISVDTKALESCHSKTLTLYCDQPVIDEGRIVFVPSVKEAK